MTTPYVEKSPITFGTAAGDNINATAGTFNGASNLIKYGTGTDFNGNAGYVRLYGGAGNDALTGTVNCDTLKGGDGNDLLRGGAGCDQLYGNDGSDAFYFTQNDLGTKYAPGTTVTASMWNPQTGGDMIMDFGGAGGWAASNNDIISFNGFGTAANGAHIDYLGTVAGFPTAAVYAVTSAANKGGFISLFTVQLANPAATTHLAAGDYQFNA